MRFIYSFFFCFLVPEIQQDLLRSSLSKFLAALLMMNKLILSINIDFGKLLGKHLNISDVGNGECTKSPILALGCFARIIEGTNKR